jgi:hypothetical protein
MGQVQAVVLEPDGTLSVVPTADGPASALTDVPATRVGSNGTG